MRAVVLMVFAVVAAGVDVSMRPWLPTMGGSAIITAIVIVYAALQSAGYAYVWFTIATTMLADVFLGAPLGARPVLFLAALVLVKPFMRTFRQQRGFLPLAAIGIVLITVEHLRIMVGQPVRGWVEWWKPVVYAWASAVVWITVVSFLTSRVLLRRTPLHATTPI